MSHRLPLRSVLACGLVLVVGCDSGGGDPGVAPPVPALSALAPDYVVLHPGESHTWTVSVDFDASTEAANYKFRWNNESGLVPDDGSVRVDGQLAYRRVARGTEEATFTAEQVGVYLVRAIVEVCDGPHYYKERWCERGETNPAFVLVWGGEPAQIQSWSASERLVVGEERPLAARALRALEPGEATGLRQYDTSHVPVAFSSDKPEVVSVDADGVLVARAAGEATITLSAGSVQRAVAVRVDEGPPGPPPQGMHTITDLIVRSTDRFSGLAGDDRASVLALDSRGYPRAVLYAMPGREDEPKWDSAREAPVLASWTGSGFGFETIGPAWDQPMFPALAIDAGDHAWVAWYGGLYGVVTVSEQLAPGQWRHYELPSRLDPTEPNGYSEGRVNFPAPEVFRRALLADPAGQGGVWVAYDALGPDVDAEPTPNPNAEPCAHVLRLARVVDGQVSTEEVAVDRYEGFDRCQEATSGEPVEFTDLHLLPPAPGGDRPRVLAVKAALDSGTAVMHSFEGGRWQARRWFPGADIADQLTLYQQAPVRLAVVRPHVPGGPTGLLVNGRGTWYERLDAHEPAGLDAGGALKVDAQVGGQDFLYGLHADGRLFVGEELAGPWAVFRDDGVQATDDPFPRLLPETETSFLLESERLPMRGRLAWDNRLYALIDGNPGLRLGVVNAPRLPQAHDGEAVGRRVFVAGKVPEVLAPPVGLPGGARFVLSEGVPGADPGLWGSDGDGAPFELRTHRSALDITRLLADGPELWALVATGTGASLHSSTDGATWSDAGAVEGVGGLLDAAMVDGAPHLLFAGDAQTEAQLLRRDAAGTTTDLLAGADPVGKIGAGGLAVGAETLAVVLRTSPGNRLAFRRLDRATGALQGQGLSAATYPPSSGYDAHHVALVETEAGARILLLGGTAASLGYQHKVLSTDDEGGTLSETLLGEGLWDRPLKPVQTADGRVALLSSRVVSLEQQRAFISLSADGETWTETPSLRPDGGALQTPMGLAPSPDGGLLSLVGDNHGFRAWLMNDLQVPKGARLPVEPLLVHTPLP